MNLLFCASIVSILGFSLCCEFHPSLWCSSEEIAKKCQVEDQCVNHFANLEYSPVKFTLYYESLCPDCIQLIKKQLWPTWKTIQNTKVFDLDLVPYGNADEFQRDGKWYFTCQHGLNECAKNLIETCSLHIMKNVTAAFPYIHCVEITEGEPVDVGKKCAEQHGINYAEIDSCTKSKVGNTLQHQMAVRTDALKPAHKYVPWVTLNGVHTDAIQQKAEANLLGLICDNYKGPAIPACKKSMSRRCSRL